MPSPADRLAVLERQLHRQRLFNLIAVGLIAVAVLLAFRTDAVEQFDEIDVERLNVRRADGTLALTISGPSRWPGMIVEGEQLGRHRHNTTGFLFFNEEETEMGGLIYAGHQDEEGRSAGGSLTFDRYNQDQVVQMMYNEDDSDQVAGFFVNDRPGEVSIAEQYRLYQAIEEATGQEKAHLEEELAASSEGTAQRIAVESRNRVASIRLRDSQSRTRLRLVVDSLDAARIEFLDTTGTVTHRWPE